MIICKVFGIFRSDKKNPEKIAYHTHILYAHIAFECLS